MRSLAVKLWRCESGAVGSAELMFLVTVLSLGIVVGAKSLRDTAVAEFADFAQAMTNLDQSYNVPDVLIDNGQDGIEGTPDDIIFTGSGFADAPDFCDVDAADSPDSSNVDGSWGAAGGKFTDPIEFALPPTGE